MENKGGVG